MSDISIGIDLGTTNSCAACLRKIQNETTDNRIEVIKDISGLSLIPSIVSFTDTNCFVSEAAKIRSIQNHQNTIRNIKRIIGIEFDKINEKDKSQYNLSRNDKDNSCLINVTYKNKKKNFTPVQISSFILSYIKTQIDTFTNKNIVDVVITVPANFNQNQIKATRDAAKLANLNVIRIIKEPTAAAIAYYYNQNINNEQKIVVFDLGGGTLDISILSLNKGYLEVIYTNGDNHLGGEDFDERLVEFCAQIFEEEKGINIRNNSKAMQRLKIACEKVKRDLSDRKESLIDLDNLIDSENFISLILRADFEKVCDDLFQKTIKILDDSLKKVKLDKNKIDDIILVGGSTHIPKIQEYIIQYFNKKKDYFQNKKNKSIDVEHSVAIGAAIQAGIIQKNNEQLNFFVKEIYPKFIAISTIDNRIYKIIKEFSNIPTETKHLFQSSYDNQKIIDIILYEGDNDKNQELRKIYQFKVEIPPKKKGEVQIEVNVKIDVNSILILEIRNNFSFKKEIIEINIDDGQKNKINYKDEGNLEDKYVEFKKQINSLEKELEKDNQNISILTNLIENYGSFLELIDIEKINNEIFQEEYLLCLQKLINEYINLFTINNQKRDFQKIEYLLEKVKPIHFESLIPSIKKLEIFNELYYELILKIIIKFQRYTEKNIKIADFCLKIMKSILEQISKVKNPKMYETINNNYILYNRKVEVLKKIKEGDDKFSKIKRENKNIEFFSSIILIYKEALKLIVSTDEKIRDDEYAIICLIRILMIQYEYSTFNIKSFLKNYYQIMLFQNSHLFEIKENKKWLDKMKEKKEKIENEINPLDEIDIVFETYRKDSPISFIKFILDKYPVNNNKFQNIEENFINDRKKIINEISIIYHPENHNSFQNINSSIKGVTFNTIYQKIDGLLNDLLKTIDNIDEESTIILTGI